ncbi:MAG: hypothetical protein ABI644_02330 [Arenimonas sp.]
MQPKKIAILFHERDTLRRVSRYVLHGLAEHWKSDGHEVDYLFGTKEFRAADLILIHVDLSIVPDSYLAFAQRYPIVLNGKIRDIRKSTYSKQLLHKGDSYEGPVFVKSDLNFSGGPERNFNPSVKQLFSDIASRFSNKPKMRKVADYRVFNNLSEVPEAYFSMTDVVIEKFLPEMDNGRFVVRNYQFLGDRGTATKVIGSSPMVKSRTEIESIEIEPDPEIVAIRHAMNFDYGKFDYVLRDGKVVLFDANKTTGSHTKGISPQLQAMRKYRAEGLYWYFKNR